ncbi:hypothetical protein Bbelb_366470 [Branchiostoma belcheri]|nr:hypothetical protein Bbelb_366470 [Branchiostoma belcheri]
MPLYLTVVEIGLKRNVNWPGSGSKPAIEGPSAICLQGHVSPERSGIQANYVVNSPLADPVTDGATFSHSSTPSARCPPNAGLERLEVLKDLGRRAGLFVPSLWSGSDRSGIRIVYTGSRSGRESVSPSASLPPEPPCTLRSQPR